MKTAFSEMLAVGGKSNSLGKVDEVIKHVFDDKERLEELYDCLSNPDAWVRMRAADALEKVCRVHPEWLQPLLGRMEKDMAPSSQASLQWHLAQIYRQVELSNTQKQFAVRWLKQLLSIKDVDWIVAANAMDTLCQFVRDGSISKSEVVPLLKVQQKHKSKSVAKRAEKLLTLLT